MNDSKKYVLGGLMFGALALLGPIARWATWPPSIDAASDGGFWESLILLLWPTQALATIEVSVGIVTALTIAITSNFLFLLFLGVFTVFFSKRPISIFLMYAAVSSLIVLFASWGAGFDYSFLNLPATLIALTCYALPFLGVALLARSAGAESGRHTGSG